MAIITITGTPGSGKTTLAKLLAQKLGYEHYSIGGMRREIAQSKGITLEELNRRSATGEEDTDTPIDAYQQKLGETKDNFVTDGRTGFHFIPHSIKLFVDADEEERAHRLLHRESVAESPQDLADAIRLNTERTANDRGRYLKYYKLDPFDKQHYDLVLDSTHLSPEELVAQVLQKFPQIVPVKARKRRTRQSTPKKESPQK